MTDLQTEDGGMGAKTLDGDRLTAMTELLTRLAKLTTVADEQAEAAAGVQEGAVTLERPAIDALILEARAALKG